MKTFLISSILLGIFYSSPALCSEDEGPNAETSITDDQASEQQEKGTDCLQKFPDLISDPQNCEQFECAGFTKARDMAQRNAKPEDIVAQNEKAWRTFQVTDCWKPLIKAEKCLESGGSIEYPGKKRRVDSKSLPNVNTWCMGLPEVKKRCIGTKYCVEENF